MKFDKSLFSFEGRARRSQFWLTRILVGVVVLVLWGIFAAIMGAVVPPDGQATSASASPVLMIFPLLLFVVFIFAFWIDLAVAVKRCHDRDKSGWFVLASLIPIIGWIWVLVELGFLDGAPRPNQYGPSPKYPDPVAQAFT